MDSPFAPPDSVMPPTLPPAVLAKSPAVTGVSLLMVGFLVAWIPFVGLVGEVLVLVGFIILYLRRDDYDAPFRRFVVLGSNLLFVGVVAVVVELVGAVLLFGLFGGSSPNPWTVALLPLLPTGLLAASVVFVVYGAADPTSRRILWIGYAAALATAFATAAVQGELFTTGLAPSSFHTLVGVQFGVNLLAVVPYSLFAWGYYRVRSGLLGWARPAA